MGYCPVPGFRSSNYPMRINNTNAGGRLFARATSSPAAAGLTVFLLLMVAGCSGTASADPVLARSATLKQIAADYARDGNLERVKAALDALDVANPLQILVTVAEQGITEGASFEETARLAALASDLGARSPKLLAYLEPTAAPVPPSPTFTLQPPSPMPLPSATLAVASPAASVAPTTVTSEPTWTPPPPHVVADSDVNLRSGPGKAYPVVGKLLAGQEANIIARNSSGDWWQLAWDGGNQAWVAGTVVQVLGPIDTVTVAASIPTPPPPPPTNTPAPPPPPTATPKPSVAYVVKSLRLRPVGEGAQSCGGGGDHLILVTVVDPGGNPLDGVRVREVFTNRIFVTGAKGPGFVEYDIYGEGGGQVDVVDENNNRIGELSRGMSAGWPPADLMWDAGYCNCKPHPDFESCRADLENRTYAFAWSHYVYEVVYQRTF